MLCNNLYIYYNFSKNKSEFFKIVRFKIPEDFMQILIPHVRLGIYRPQPCIIKTRTYPRVLCLWTLQTGQRSTGHPHRPAFHGARGTVSHHAVCVAAPSSSSAGFRIHRFRCTYSTTPTPLPNSQCLWWKNCIEYMYLSQWHVFN